MRTNEFIFPHLSFKYKRMSEENDNLSEFWGASSSYVWKHFGFESEVIDGKKEIKKQFAVCRVCKAKLRYHGGTSSLGNHLRVKHSISGSVSTVTQKEDTVKQTSIKEAFGVTHPLPRAKKKHWTEQ